MQLPANIQLNQALLRRAANLGGYKDGSTLILQPLTAQKDESSVKRAF